MQNDKELYKFIKVWKLKISRILKIKKEKIILINPKYNELNSEFFSLYFVYMETNIKIQYEELYYYNEIKSIEEKNLLSGFLINTDIFDPEGNNQNGGWGIGEERGGEKYIPPLDWIGYGLKVRGKYDNGDDTWLGYNKKEGVFAIAYFGLSNNEKKKIL